MRGGGGPWSWHRGGKRSAPRCGSHEERTSDACRPCAPHMRMLPAAATPSAPHVVSAPAATPFATFRACLGTARHVAVEHHLLLGGEHAANRGLLLAVKRAHLPRDRGVGSHATSVA